jgi:transketolase
MSSNLDELCINTIRTLSMDAVQQANSGHPGTPMALAPTAYVLWQRFLRYDPDDPAWPNRDRFVLSAGHASMLLYSVLHLAGVKDVKDETEVTSEPAITLEDIKRFRQIDGKCAGHPEYRLAGGIETTTGPLGQGIGNSVGMAIAARWQAAHFNRPGFELFDYRVYAICSDGDLMEGISNEAASVAGHLRLANLCWIYDNNHITIEGETELAYDDNVPERFHGYNWNVAHVADANDLSMLENALKTAQATIDRPTLIIVDSHIGYGAPHRQDTALAHGEALGEDEVRGAKRFYGWPEDAKFMVPDGVRQHFQDGLGKRGRSLHGRWLTQLKQYQSRYPDLADQMQRMQKRQLPEGWDKNLPVFPADAKGMATRESGGKVLSALGQNIPWLLGGAADLAPSTKTLMKFDGAGDLEAGNPGGRNMHFGIREHTMGAIVNGLSVSKLRAFGSTFLIFSDYMRPTLRLGALMEIPTIFVYTHDSIGLGEDGPTHQPIEHLASLRAIPNLVTLRPADANEVVEAWRVIMQLRDRPAALILTRQAVPTFDRSKLGAAAGVAKGAYVLIDPADGKPQVILMASGSEVYLCVQASEQLKSQGIRTRVVSMPSWELFDQQTREYQESVLPSQIRPRVYVETAATFGWCKYVGRSGAMIGMHRFGASAPIKDLLKKFGFVPENIVAAAKEQLRKSRGS